VAWGTIGKKIHTPLPVVGGGDFANHLRELFPERADHGGMELNNLTALPLRESAHLSLFSHLGTIGRGNATDTVVPELSDWMLISPPS
jgi:hypothetical protein